MIDKSNFPVQKLPLSKKTEVWRQASLDAVISRESGGFYSSTRKTNMSTWYGLYNSEYDEKDLKYVTNPFKVEDGFPAKVQNFNIIRPKIDLLIGEESKRPWDPRVIQTNPDVVTQLQDKKKELLMQYIQAEVGIQKDDQGQPVTPKEIEKYMKYNYKTIAEETAYHALNYLRQKLNLDNEFLKGWKDGLLSTEEIYYVSVMNGEPMFERVNPMNCDYDKDPDIEFIEDGDWFVRYMQMSPANIYDRFFDIMEESDLDRMLEYAGEGHFASSILDTKNPPLRDSVTKKYISAGTQVDLNLIDVYHGVWRSYKKIGFLKYADESGQEHETVVSEEYVASPEEQIEWDWIPEVWEGYKIGSDIYIGMGPVEYQHTSIDSISSRKLPYCGIIYNNTNTQPKSLVGLMKPLQYMYIILWYRLELALARDKGKVINMDITQIPRGLGISVDQWMHYLTAAGVNFINPYDEGWDVPGREGGKPASFNQITAIDLSMQDIVAGYIGLMVKIEDMIGEISGVSKQRQGQIQRTELVGNVERAVVQSSHITEPLFWYHNQAKKNAVTMLLNVAKHAWKETPGKSIHYVLNDAERIFLNIEDDFLYSDLDIFVGDNTKQNRDIEAIKTLLQPAMQNGATLLEAAEILSTENLSQIKLKLQEIEERKQMLQSQQAKMESDQIQIENELKMEELRIKSEDSVRKAETLVQVELIKQAAASVTETGEGGTSPETLADFQMKMDKQRKDAELKEDQLKEVVRKNKKAEDQKQQEIEIKRKQANRPVSPGTNNK
jgi:hypothetical protein